MNSQQAFTSENEKAHGANWRRWLGHLKDKKAVGLELGTWRGESAAWFCENIFTHEYSEFYCIDTFKGSEEHHLAGVDCTDLEQVARDRLDPYLDRAVIFKGESHTVLHDLNVVHEIKLDFAYIDAAHDAMNVLRDSVLAFDLLKVGGIMVWDDYLWSVMPSAVECPKLGIDAFLNCYAKQVEVIGLGWQVAVRRVA